MKETMGCLIRRQRLHNGLTKKKLSELTKLSRSYITELEEDKYSNPSIRVLCLLCRYFKCTPNDLIPKHYYQ